MTVRTAGCRDCADRDQASTHVEQACHVFVDLSCVKRPSGCVSAWPMSAAVLQSLTARRRALLHLLAQVHESLRSCE